MRLCLAIFALLCLGAGQDVDAGGLAASIDIGDTREQVIHALGQPMGKTVFGTVEVLQYPRGQVDLENGVVIRHDVISLEELEARERNRQPTQEKVRNTIEQQTPTSKQEAETAESHGGQQADQALTAEQQAELDQRIADGLSEPPIRMSSRKLRRYRRGRSPSQLEQREQQIVDSFTKELEDEAR